MANDLNQCSFIGRLGQDPEIRYLQSGDAVASFSIACGSKWKDKEGEQQERTEWIPCTAFGGLAEIIGEYLTKGSQVFVQGRFKTDKYEKDGQTRYSTKIVVDTMQMLGSKRDSESSGHSDAGSGHSAGSSGRKAVPSGTKQSYQDAKDGKPAPKGNYDNFDDDIPI